MAITGALTILKGLATRFGPPLLNYLGGFIVEQIARYILKKNGVDVDQHLEKQIKIVEEKIEHLFTMKYWKDLSGTLMDKIYHVFHQIMTIFPELPKEKIQKKLDQLKHIFSTEYITSIPGNIKESTEHLIEKVLDVIPEGSKEKFRKGIQEIFIDSIKDLFKKRK